MNEFVLFLLPFLFDYLLIPLWVVCARAIHLRVCVPTSECQRMMDPEKAKADGFVCTRRLFILIQVKGSIARL